MDNNKQHGNQQKTISDNTTLSKSRHTQTKEMYKLKDKYGNIITDRKQKVQVIETFYADLYKLTTSDQVNLDND